MTDTLHYPLDFEAYSIDEIKTLVDFLASIEAYHENTRSVSKESLVKKHQRFQSILNNKSEEKRIDRAFKKQTGISIYRTMQSLK
ncbi:MAG: UPF0223 family protein [Bacillota bacterium]